MPTPGPRRFPSGKPFAKPAPPPPKKPVEADDFPDDDGRDDS